jgi:hypothetical protein
MTMPDTPIAPDIDEALDIKVNLFPEISLDGIFLVDKLSEVIHFLFGKVIGFGIRVDAGASQNPLTQRGTDTVNILQ